MQKPCKATYFCGHVISNLFCLVFPSNLQSITAVILYFSNKTGSIFSYLKTNFAGNALIEPILIYVKDNTIRSRLNDVRQIPGNSSYLVFAPRASIIIRYLCIMLFRRYLQSNGVKRTANLPLTSYRSIIQNKISCRMLTRLFNVYDRHIQLKYENTKI